MSALTASERIARAAHDLRLGLPVGVQLEGSVWLVASVETLTAERWQFLQKRGGLQLALTARRSETLRIVPYDGDLSRIMVPKDSGLGWLKALADPSIDLLNPLKGPFKSLRGGPADPHRLAIHLCKKAHLLPAALVIEVEQIEAGFSVLCAEDFSAAGKVRLHEVSSARVPLEVSKFGRVHVFRPDDGSEEHYAIEIGTPERKEPVLVRLHSACFTGDLIGSLKCDCGPQLRAALAQIGAGGAGVLLYMNQEGRGIGLANKMRAYSLQDEGFDTVEANHRLGFEDDERDFELGAQMLKALGFDAVRLMTNNPAKVAKMESSGLDVAERVPLKVGENPHNAEYLAVKAKKSGHIL
ncbi:MAG: GTP cyclohydrolase II [Rhodobacteraceae bacterium]|nr:GTP cyclohydrolase II [Paracoccaceae bacterium]